MKIAIVGQQDFGKAVLEAFLARGDEVAGVFCAPEKPGAKPDVLKVAAQEKGIQVFQFPSLKAPEAIVKKMDVRSASCVRAHSPPPQDFVTLPGTEQSIPPVDAEIPRPSPINGHSRGEKRPA